MPYITGKGYVLSASQEKLMQDMIKCVHEVKQSIIEKWGNEHFGWKIPVNKTPSYVLGWLVQPEPKRSHEIVYQPRYGVVCHNLCTSNGNARMIASCVTDDTVWIENEFMRDEIFSL